MLTKNRSFVLSALLAVFFSSVIAVHATDGYFQTGYGVRAEGSGGAGVAFPQDALAPAINPAGISRLDDRFDVGVQYFRPIRKAEITGNAVPGNNISYNASGEKDFFIPQLGYKRHLGRRFDLGVAVYGNGGMNTTYTRNVTLFGSSKAGVDLSQAFLTPALSYKVSRNHSLGLGVNFAYQRFKATGLENFASFPGLSENPENLTNRGYDTSTGWGARSGWTGRLARAVTMGATYQTKTKMSTFKKYSGLFAERGGFDIPANYAAGLAVKPISPLTVAFDVQKIEYSNVRSVGERLLPAFNNAQLGSNGSAGFGWRDAVVEKLGLIYDVNKSLILRAGFNHTSQPIPPSETLFNLLAPGVVEDHLSLGTTVKTSERTDLSLAYVHAFKKTVSGSNSIPSGFGGGEADLTMHQDTFSIAYGLRFR